jgi:hypothetical protein
VSFCKSAVRCRCQRIRSCLLELAADFDNTLMFSPTRSLLLHLLNGLLSNIPNSICKLLLLNVLLDLFVDVVRSRRWSTVESPPPPTTSTTMRQTASVAYLPPLLAPSAASAAASSQCTAITTLCSIRLVCSFLSLLLGSSSPRRILTHKHFVRCFCFRCVDAL